jgi:cytochrome P450
MIDWQDVDNKITDNNFYASQDYHEMFRMMRREDPVHLADGAFGRPLWCLTRYDDTVAVLSDTDTFSSRFGGFLPISPQAPFTVDREKWGYGALPTFSDNPKHMKYRKPFNKHFTAPAIASRTATVRTLVGQIIDEIAERGECDFVEDLVGQLPIRLMCDLMGVPREDWNRLSNYAKSFMGGTDPEYQRPGMTLAQSQEAAMLDLYHYMIDLALERRKNPTDDFTSMIGVMQEDGQPWADRDVGWWCFAMISGGLNTTRDTMGVGFYTLLQNPDQMERLRADPSLMPTAVEEVMRWATVSKHKLRIATRDVEIRGHRIRKGDWVVPWLVSANRDEEVFDDPYKFDVGRNPNPHVSFGVTTGDHFCLGRNLARLEVRIAYEEILRRMRNIELVGDVEWLASSNSTGIKHLPIRYEVVESARTPELV